jgi:hypothetical protein
VNVERIAQLERRLKELSSIVDAMAQQSRGTSSPATRLARAVAGGSTYPTQGQTFRAELLDGTFALSTGPAIMPSYTLRHPETIVVCNTVCCVPPENTVVLVSYWKGRWWTTWCCTEAAPVTPITHGAMEFRQHVIFNGGILQDAAVPSSVVGDFAVSGGATTFTKVSNCWIVPPRPVVERRLEGKNPGSATQTLTQLRVELCGSIPTFSSSPTYEETIQIGGSEFIVPVSWNAVNGHQWELDVTDYVNALVGPVNIWHLVRVSAPIDGEHIDAGTASIDMVNEFGVRVDNIAY